MKRRSFSRADKLRLIAPLLAGELSVTEHAECCGVGRTTLQRWLAQYRRLGDAAFPGSGHSRLNEDARLRQRLADATRELEILKKAQAYFDLHRP